MNILPKDLKKIITNYKDNLEHQDNVENHKVSFNKSLNIIKNLRNNNYIFGFGHIITIGVLTHKKPEYIYCYCFQVCLNCHNIISSSRMNDNNIGNMCKCY